MRAELGKRACVSMVLSGTASGVMGAAWVAREAGHPNVITLDIGGTSADVALIIDGQPQFGLGEKIGDLPLYIPSVAVSSIGDGGGSIAWVDGFGVLKVGPESAGSAPGPACYGRGGTLPTITDAFAVCGFLGQHDLAYGAFRPDVALARAAIGTLASRIDLGLEQTAEAIIRIAISGMFVEVNKLVARYGVDTRDFALLPFGGAGPMLGCFLARELGMQRVLDSVAPRRGQRAGRPGRQRQERLHPHALHHGGGRRRGRSCATRPRRCRPTGTAWLRDDQEFTGEAAYAWFADMRYRGQSFEIEVPLASSLVEAGDMAAIAEAFHRAHEGIYDFCDRDSAVQIMNLRLVVSGSSPKPYLRPLARATSEAPVAEQTLKVFFDGDWHDVPFYRRAALRSASPLLRPLRHRAGRHDGLRAARLRRHGGRQRQHRSRAGGVTAMKVDKVTLEILANHMRAAAESMAYTLYRTAHSTFVKETEDFTIQILDAAGRTAAVPMDLGATWYPGLDYGRAIPMIPDYEPGDIALTNDPYSGYLATHTPDLVLWKPIFHEGELLCFTAGHIHNTDMGGAVPASLSRALTEIHQEGIRFKPTKLYRAGVLNQELLDVMMTNVRKPDLNVGDLKAFVGAMNTGERKVRELIAKFGPDTLRQGMSDLLDYAEHQAREILRSIPDGEYFFSDYADEDGPDGYPARLAVTLRIEGDSAILDFTGSDPQLTSSLNVPTGGNPHHTLMLVGVYYILYSLNPNLVLNFGLTRPFHCILPEGTVVNPQFPAAVGMRSLTCGRIRSLLFGAFGQAMPERMPAAPAGSSSIVNVMTHDDRTGEAVIAAVNPVVGGSGGMPTGDGTNGSGADAAYLKNTPVEITEAEVPIRFRRYGLASGTGGAGRWRGGLATHMEFQVFTPNTRITARNRDRCRFQAWGVLGGKAGRGSTMSLNPGRPDMRVLNNIDTFTAGPGDIVSIVSPGGGGRGDPLDREPERVLRDVICNYVAIADAEAEYGVVLTGLGDDRGVDLAVDLPATEALRAQRRRNEPHPHFHFGAAREAYERVWTRERLRRHDRAAGQPARPLAFLREEKADGRPQARGQRRGRRPGRVAGLARRAAVYTA